MRLLVIWRLADGVSEPDVAPHMESEEKWAWAAYRDDFLREHYLTDDGATVVSVLEATTLEEAKGRIETLPLFAAGLIKPEFLQLRPFMNWEVLFAKASDGRGAT
ncbi:hypothetical protein [uncultured Roseobacter sp.]|uniref:hypothetical protein n=1 Tax=uncultured Roseobacter sp. TaxID=114847 RepID=UPI00262E2C87|nr:hypothetical protein [uncultured Roseobacter sp.]